MGGSGLGDRRRRGKVRRLRDRLLNLLGLGPRVESTQRAAPAGPVRPRYDHVILLDGTMSSLEPGEETNVGLIWKLLRDMPRDPAAAHQQMVHYEAGVQWQTWRRFGDVALGRGLDRQIRRAYGWLATRYRPGDRIFLIGYSRGAYAVRSLAGVIDGVGLLRHDEATERNIRQAFRHYELSPGSPAARTFAALTCHASAEVEMVGVFDTVKALGLRLPLLWMLTEPRHAFHSHQLGPAIRHGFQALALDETRAVFTPVMWTCPEGWTGRVEQMWFRGAHGDVGGQLGGFHAARGLSNIPLVWMLSEAERCGLMLPEGWRARFPMDPEAPSVGCWRGIGKLFILRSPRRVGADPSERLHPTAQLSPRARRLRLPGAVSHAAE
ncbi:MAG: DUF2235 domain-containing protein [Defluviimonas sp.]|nr:DUF2235 domain-containing protein [Defluviimonas sp.]